MSSQAPTTQTLHCSNCQAELDLSKAVKEFYCEKCGEVKDEGDLTTKYECSSCGSEYTRENSADGDSNRCPDCNKFGTLQHENACDSCEEEVLEVDVVECQDCGTFTTVEKAKEAEVYPAKPKTETERFPYKKGQEFKLKAPYEHADPFRPESRRGIGETTVATLHSMNRLENEERVKQVGFSRYANMEVKTMHEGNSLGTSYTSMTLGEVVEHWVPITYQEAMALVVSFRVCENCGAKGADYRHGVLRDFSKPLLPSGKPDVTPRFVCDGCYDKSQSISEPIQEAVSEASRKAFTERLQKEGVVCEPCKAKYPNQSIDFFTFLPDEIKSHMKRTHKGEKKVT